MNRTGCYECYCFTICRTNATVDCYNIIRERTEPDTAVSFVTDFKITGSICNSYVRFGTCIAGTVAVVTVNITQCSAIYGDMRCFKSKRIVRFCCLITGMSGKNIIAVKVRWIGGIYCVKCVIVTVFYSVSIIIIVNSGF